MLPVAGLAYEAIRLSSKPGSPRFLSLLVQPGLWTQRLSTAEPTDEMIEVALVSLRVTLNREACLEKQGGELPPMRSLRFLASLDEVAEP
jgi:uncharacterized protein YqhQ